MTPEYPCPKCGSNVAWNKHLVMDNLQHGACSNAACRWKTDPLKQGWYPEPLVPFLLSEIRFLISEREVYIAGTKEAVANWKAAGAAASRRTGLLQRCVWWIHGSPSADELLGDIKKELGE